MIDKLHDFGRKAIPENTLREDLATIAFGFVLAVIAALLVAA